MAVAILDTNAISDLMRDHPHVTAQLVQYHDPIATRVVVMGEIRYGLLRLPIGKKRNDLETRAQRILGAVQVLPITESVAERYGRLKALLERQGVNAGDNDLCISATAIDLGAVVVSRDKGFTFIPGLQVADWTI